MSLHVVTRPHHHAHGRPLACSLYRLVVVLPVLCICASAVFVWRPAILRTPSSLFTSLSGHSYHPKLCSTPGDPAATSNSSQSAAASGGCSELHDPHLADEAVHVPPGMQLRSGDTQIAQLQQLLQTAVQQQWPLPLARRLVTVLLQGAVPPVQGSNSSSTSGSGSGTGLPQQQTPTNSAAMLISAAESGHAAGWRFATQAVTVLKALSNSQLVPCSFDPSLPTDFHTRFLFSAVWPAGSPSSNPSSSALGNSVLQLLSAVALLPPGYAFISVSVPAGAAADVLVWLDLLQLLAAPLGVPVALSHVSPTGDTTHVSPTGDTSKAADSVSASQVPGHGAASRAHRAALAAFFPAWQAAPAEAAAALTHQAAPAATADQQESGQLDQAGRRRLQQQRQLDAASSSSSSGSASGRITHGGCPAGAPSPSCYQPEFVVLFDPQLYVCAGDLVRLMEYPEDLVCGIHLDEFKPVQLRHRAASRRLHTTQQQQQQGTAALEGPMAAAVAAASQAELQPEVPPEFELHSLRAAYDATREISGELLSTHAPYFSHSASVEVVTGGLPVPVYCCWGGVAKLRAGPLADGLRFRGGEAGECHSPDAMSLLCDDLWRTGNNHILLDPGVRTSSQLRTKSLFEHPRFPFFYYTQNWETTAWFDIHPLLPLQYWNQSAVWHGSSSRSTVGGAEAASEPSRDAVDATDGNAAAAAASPPVSVSSIWQPGKQQMCCEGQQWAGAARPNHPTDCRRVQALVGKNFTHVFLQRCASGRQGSQGSGQEADCG